MIKWYFSERDNRWELYVDGSFKDHVKVEYSLVVGSSIFYTGSSSWMNLDTAKKELEDFYAS